MITHWAHRFGVSPLMRRMRREVRAKGWKLRVRWGRIEVDRGTGGIIFSVGDIYRVVRWVRYGDPAWDRLVPNGERAGAWVDLRMPLSFRLRSGDVIKIIDLPEVVDPFAGYIARGGPRPGEVVLDVGAFIGEYTIEFSRLVGEEGHVFALEPDPLNREVLARNVAATGVRNVTMLPWAMWNKTTLLAFTARGDSGAGVTELDEGAGGLSTGVMVAAVSAVELFARMGRVPDFVKMDIEGAEVEALESMVPWLVAAGRPCRLAIASYHTRAGRITHEMISPVLREAGFTVETGYAGHLTTWAARA